MMETQTKIIMTRVEITGYLLTTLLNITMFLLVTLNIPVTQMIPGISDIETVGIFAAGTALFLISMWSFYKKLKAKKAKEKLV